MQTLGDHYLETVLFMFRRQKSQAEKAFSQLSDDELHVTIDPEANSIAILVKHMAGNMRSRWHNFLTEDGEKADRHRDTEFIDDLSTREAIMQAWEKGWNYVFTALEPLTGEDLLKHVYVRGEPFTVVQAVERQLDHYAHHVGQIVFLAKHLKAKDWQSLSIPRGQSEAFNAAHGKKF